MNKLYNLMLGKIKHFTLLYFLYDLCYEFGFKIEENLFCKVGVYVLLVLSFEGREFGEWENGGVL